MTSSFRRPAHAAAAGDPIPFVHDGRLHLFYLSSPLGTRDYPDRVRTTWQHAVSADLRDWDERPPAIEPGPPGSYDAGGIWTGSVVEHDGVFHAFYTAHDPTSDRPQTIAVATSTDLETFEKSPDNPMLGPVPGYDQVDWRDPYVFFNEAESLWWMLIATRRPDGPQWRRGCITLATSPDLRTWTVEDEPLYEPGTTVCPECPELWELDGTWHLVYSTFSGAAGTVDRVANSPRGPFRVPDREHLGGRRWYAAKSAPWGAGRTFFGWVHDMVEQPDGGRRWLWGGDFARPRIITSAPGKRGPVLVSRLAIDAAEGASLPRVIDGVGIGRPGGREEVVLLDDVPSRVVVDVEYEAGDAAAVGFELVAGQYASATCVTLDLVADMARLTREPAPLDDFWADLTGRGAEYREVDGPVLAELPLRPLPGGSGAGRRRAVRMVLEGELIEVAVDDDVVLAHRIRRDRARLTAFCVDGRVTVTGRVAVLP